MDHSVNTKKVKTWIDTQKTTLTMFSRHRSGTELAVKAGWIQMAFILKKITCLKTNKKPQQLLKN